MSAKATDETEALVIKLLQKMERKGKNIQSVLWKLMDYFENEEVDEKNDENKIDINNNTVSLLYDKTAKNVCKVGHRIRAKSHKHLSIEPCVICGNKNNNKQNKMKLNNVQILEFINQYNMDQIPFGPNEKHKRGMKTWKSRGWDKQWPLHVAVQLGDVAMIKRLCKNKNINLDQKLTDWGDALPISVAARNGQLEALIELIKQGANAIPPPDKQNATPYKHAVSNNHKAIILFYQQYIKYVHNFDINQETNLQCHYCYNYDLYFNEYIMNGTMAKYVYCNACTIENVKKIQMKQKDNEIIERRIIKTLKDNPSISVDTLCQMKDVKSLHTILKEIFASGQTAVYSLWLLDIDNFKSINSNLTHAVADTKIQALAEILKELQPKTRIQWRESGYDGINKIYAFRQGGDEFALVVRSDTDKFRILQKLYDRLKKKIKKIKLENIPSMPHITVSIGVCCGQAIDTYQQIMKQADLAAEMVKNGGKNGMVIYYGQENKFHKNFNDIYIPV